MSDYKKLIQKEAQEFLEGSWEQYKADEGEFGGKSGLPNLPQWIDSAGTLSSRIGEIASKWTHRDYIWVETNTRNRSKDAGGDRSSKAYVSFLQDVRHEIKKLAKKKR
tara:strand:+ start:686 stop:1009 length:324 start_codon:yes stop_codon:yes gene_type:complete